MEEIMSANETKETKNTAPLGDVKKDYKYLFSPKKDKPEIVDVPAFKYLKIDGRGNPNNEEEFGAKVGLLYGLAYTIKFMLKKDQADPFEFKVAPLSGLWHADDMDAFVQKDRRDEWIWTLMILMPDPVTNEVFEAGKAALIKKKNPTGIDKVYFELYDEGHCAQIMHIGPYSEEGPTIKNLHSFFTDQGYEPSGQHHEIYLGDPRKAKPEKLKTIIRQPIKKKS
jgi:hypothetical protein